ncbi:Amyloid protein [Operophtera brumata]|uniref:Amyloid protein n=1 Tax=Operophtera brumata TaxID=104452 RepID=A0A0L7LUV2_OPEBR|nr:Amyloid protein [Operophtera brumata]
MRVRYPPSGIPLTRAGFIVPSLSLPGGSIYTTLYGYICRTTISTQVFGVRYSRLVATRVLGSIADAKMSRAVLFISVFAIFLDVLHAGQVRRNQNHHLRTHIKAPDIKIRLEGP